MTLFPKKASKSDVEDILFKTTRYVPLIEANPANNRVSNLVQGDQRSSYVSPSLVDSRPRLHFGPLWVDSFGRRVSCPSFLRDPTHELSLDSITSGSNSSGNDTLNELSYLICGDNLNAMKALISQYCGRISTFYVDPPFNITGDGEQHLEVRYGNDHFLMSMQDERVHAGIKPFNFWELMYERLDIMKDLLCNDGSVFVHVNAKNSERMGLLMDEVFGWDQRRNQVIRQLSTPWNRNRGKSFPENHDVILWYTKYDRYRFLLPRVQYTTEQVEKIYDQIEEEGERKGERYNLQYLTAPGTQEVGKPPRIIGGEPAILPLNKHWVFSIEKIEDMEKKGEVVIKIGLKGEKRYWYKQFYNPEKTGPISSIWTDTQQKVNPSCYPCSKAPSLLERLILSTTNAGDIVGDLFCGSGLFSAVALKYGRRFVAFDSGSKAIDESRHQLQEVQKGLQRLGLACGGFATYSLKPLSLITTD